MQRLEVSTPGALECEVDGVDDLTAGPEVDGDAARLAPLPRSLVVLTKDAHIGVAEAVDRLVLVPDPEEVVPRQQLEQLVLEPVGVLELVHQHVAEATGVGLAQSLVAGEQVAGHQLEVLEVEAGALALGPFIALAVEVEQRAQQRVVAGFALRQGERAQGAVGGPVLLTRLGGDSLGAALELDLVEAGGLRRRARRERAEQLEGSLQAADGRGHRCRGRRQGELGECCAGRRLEPLVLARGGRGVRVLQGRPALPAAAQVGVDGAHHVAEAVGSVRGHHLDSLGVLALAHEGLECAVEGVESQPLGLDLVEHPEAGIDARAERVGAQHARAEAVDGRDPGALRGPCLLAAGEVEEAAAHPALHLLRGLLGEGDGEDRLHGHAVVQHGPHEALDQHGGLARARAGPHQQRARAALHGLGLFGGEVAHCSLRQIEG